MKKQLCALLFGLCALGCSETWSPGEVASPDPAPLPLAKGTPCGEVVVVPLLSEGDVEIGSASIYNDEDGITIEVATTNPWVMHRTHVAVATSLDDIPQNRDGRPLVARFPFRDVHHPATRKAIYYLSLDEWFYEPGTLLFVAVHADARRVAKPGKRLILESAWADGEPFSDATTATYFNYTVQSCEVSDPCEVTVLMPNGLEWICIGHPILFYWTAEGGCGEFVSIELLRDGEFCQMISDFAPNTGAFRWDDPTPCEPHTSDYVYTIRVTDLESGASDVSDGPFRIEVCEE